MKRGDLRVVRLCSDFLHQDHLPGLWIGRICVPRSGHRHSGTTTPLKNAKRNSSISLYSQMAIVFSRKSSWCLGPTVFRGLSGYPRDAMGTTHCIILESQATTTNLLKPFHDCRMWRHYCMLTLKKTSQTLKINGTEPRKSTHSYGYV